MNRTRAAWIDVELENIVHNVKAVQALAQKDAGRPVMAMPVIKGNAYGHGIFEVARILGESGVEWMAVAPYSEARLARLAALPGAYRVLPGHMEPSTLARERRFTPYMQMALREQG